MKKNKFYALLIFVIVFGFICCTDDTNKHEPSFIGIWDIQGGGILIFSDNIFLNKLSDEEFIGKGNWTTEKPNKLNLIYTHSRNSGNYYSENDLPVLDIPFILEFSYEFI